GFEEYTMSPEFYKVNGWSEVYINGSSGLTNTKSAKDFTTSKNCFVYGPKVSMTTGGTIVAELNINVAIERLKEEGAHVFTLDLTADHGREVVYKQIYQLKHFKVRNKKTYVYPKGRSIPYAQ